MIWLTWRQFRTQAWVAIAALAAVAVALAVTGPHLAHLYDVSGVPGCRTNCETLTRAFLTDAKTGLIGALYWLGIGLMFVTPALIGVFWGAPLVARELETGTYRLAWNQSVTRTRWLAVKLVGVGLASMATAGLFSLAVTWWSRPLDTASMLRMTPGVFAARGIVPIGCAAFAFIVGITAGLLIRRTVAAMAVTIAVLVAAQIAMPIWVRAHLITPARTTVSLDVSAVEQMGMSENGRHLRVLAVVRQPGAWVLSNRTVTPTGKVFDGPANPQACGRDISPKTCLDWIGSLGLRQVAVYQPASRFWTLQWYEATIFLGLAALLAGFCFWWVRRRLA
jgi:hypothetical protein